MTSVPTPADAGPPGPSGRAAVAGWGAMARPAGVAVVGGLAWAVLAGPFQLGWGLLAMAVFVGWAIGSATRATAGGRGARAWLIAGLAGAAAWLIGLAGVYVYLAALPSGTAEAGALTGSPSVIDYYAQAFGLLELAQGAAVVAVAWWTAR